ncbi:type II secretory pathway pseudopilin PulG [Roseovarius sp. MBR-154]|jgi:type II secretory pathway pseudopilin PulG
MPQNTQNARLTGPHDRPTPDRLSAIEVLALVVSVAWLMGAGVFFLVLAPQDPTGSALQFVIVLVAVFLPVAMLWVGAMTARASRVMREESARLHAAIDAIREAYLKQNQSLGQTVDKTVSQKLDEIVAAQRKTESTLATFSSVRNHESEPRPVLAPAPSPTEDQVALPLGTPAEEIQPPLERSDFVRALNFPENPDDKAGFAALRRALKDRPTAQLIRAAQDILTLMSQDGIYMDDLRPDMARPEIWRRFAGGERGRTVAALGGVRDRSSLALTAARMKQDTIFRDAAHHFLRLFDRMVSQFTETATDTEISALSETRTARAFMLLGRVAGTFD